MSAGLAVSLRIAASSVRSVGRRRIATSQSTGAAPGIEPSASCPSAVATSGVTPTYTSGARRRLRRTSSRQLNARAASVEKSR
jgi:hypothetical protein